MTLAFGHILASLLMAYGWNFYYEKNWNRHKLFGSSIFAYLSLKLATAIPFLGLFISMLVVMTAFGSMLLVWWKNRPMRSITV